MKDEAPNQSVFVESGPEAGRADQGRSGKSRFGNDRADEGPADGEHSPKPGRRVRIVLTPLQRALGLLVRREHSRKELTRKLIARGLDAGDVENAVDRLAGEGWQDEARFAQWLVRGRAAGGYGPIHIRAELSTHGLARDAIAAALDSFEGDWADNARELVRRRYGEAVADDIVLRRKAVNLLMRRGFDGTCIQFATRFDPDE